MINLLNRKTQIAAFLAALGAFVALNNWASPEMAQGGTALLLALVALVSRDNAPKETGREP